MVCAGVGAACKRCPEITTVTYDLSPAVREVSGLPVMEERAFVNGRGLILSDLGQL